ncbi:MAG: PHP domain-containing protein [Magnetococcales bacterium]|nr:PHP domain-containing protein [Magnetococcales bacterium]
MQRRRPKIPFFAADDLENQPFPRWEYHVHSLFSDGSSTLAALVEHARSLGITRMVFTEHTEPELTDGAGWFERYWQEAMQLRQQGQEGMEILFGLEVPIVDFKGGLLLETSMADKAEFILGAVHAYPGYGWTMGSLPPDKAIELEFNGLMALAENPLVDAIAHPGGVCQKHATPFPLTLFEEVVRKATSNGIAIELNPAYQEPIAPYLEICRRHHALISPGSNAHHLEELGWACHELSKLQRKNRLNCTTIYATKE